MDDTPDDESAPRGKVERLIREYGLAGTGDELAERWTATGDRRASLRELAARFNRLLLETRMEEAGLSPLEGEVENVHRLLTDDEVSGGVRTQAERRLERAGIDVDGLRSDFVSHQAIHTYLTEHRGVTRESGPGRVTAESVLETVRRLVGRTRTVTRNSVVRLRNAGVVTVGEFDVTVDVQLYCADCGHTYGITEFLDNGGCACEGADGE